MVSTCSPRSGGFPMPVRVTCPACDEVLHVDETLLGAKVSCGTCGTVFRAPVDGHHDDGPYPTDRGERNSGKAVAAFVLGCVGMVAWCLPILGLPVTITGL